MKDTIIELAPKGIPTPLYKAQRIRQDRDPDLFVNMLANHPMHIARAKAKAARVQAEAQARAVAQRRRQEDADQLISSLSQLSMGTTLAVILTAALAL